MNTCLSKTKERLFQKTIFFNETFKDFEIALKLKSQN